MSEKVKVNVWLELAAWPGDTPTAAGKVAVVGTPHVPNACHPEFAEASAAGFCGISNTRSADCGNRPEEPRGLL
ncbi:hypothetical protein SBA4_3350008 [Candidatus Sulfopaludibacter sp. SbA4]|nr:hypothetical protein SBA4_3350008 [Candidatus Sulfopaludibacter sp. SbA4]